MTAIFVHLVITSMLI